MLPGVNPSANLEACSSSEALVAASSEAVRHRSYDGDTKPLR